MDNKDARAGTVAILAENGYQELELWVPFYRLREEGYETVVVAPEERTYASKLGYPVTATRSAAQARADQFLGVVIPGGWAPDRLRQDDGVLKLVQGIFERGRMVAAICHAGWVLASAGVARGRTLTCYRAIRDDMIHAGAEVVDRQVVVDGNLITSRKPDDLPAFCAAMVQALEKTRRSSTA
ncbi:MAG: type 1 glutamine amidotransferase domain-containing protein [Acidobacteriota bacterium]